MIKTLAVSIIHECLRIRIHFQRPARVPHHFHVITLEHNCVHWMVAMRAEQKRRILLVLPATLRVQWQRELSEKFGLPGVILEAASASSESLPWHGARYQISPA